MTATITHSFVSGIADDPAAVAAGEVVPSKWNAAHVVTGLLSTATPLVEAGSGAPGSGTAASKDDHVHPAASGSAATLAQVLAAGNDTGNIPITAAVDDGAPGAATVTAEISATAVDDAIKGHANLTAAATATGEAAVNRISSAVNGEAVADTTVTSTGTANASANTTVTSATGSAEAEMRSNVTGANGGHASSDTSAGSVDGEAHADHDVGSTNYHARSNTTVSSGGGAYARANTEADAFGGGPAQVLHVANTDGAGGTSKVNMMATADSGLVSISVIADATRPELQVNDLPLYTTAAGAPGATFVSLIYRNSTAVTGGTYLWDFVTGAYVKIANVVT